MIVHFMSAPPRRKPNVNEGLPGCTKAEVEANLEGLPPERKERMTALLLEVAQGDFYDKKRFTQGVLLLNAMKPHSVKQKDIAVVLGVSESLVSSWKRLFRHNTTEEPPRSGPQAP